MFSVMVSIAAAGLFWFWLFLVVIQLAATLAGSLSGQRYAGDAPPRAEATGLVTGGIMALTAFVLALTLSFASGRMAERRTGALQEANAIGTAWLQATALSDPRAAAIASMLETYATKRLDFASADHAAPEIETLSTDTNLLQAQIWAEMTALLAASTTPHTVSLMNSLNNVFDMTTALRLSLSRGIPEPLVMLLVGMVLVSSGIAGFQLGLKRQRAPVLVAVLIMVWSLVIVIVLDLGAPRLGSARTVTDPYLWTISGFSGKPAT